MQFQFKLTTANGNVYFVDSESRVLSIIDNNRANKNGRVFSRIEYAVMRKRKGYFQPGKFTPVAADDLRQFGIAHIHEINTRKSDARYLMGIIIATAATTAAIFVALVWSYIVF